MLSFIFMCQNDFIGQWYIFFHLSKNFWQRNFQKEIPIIGWIGKSIKPSKRQFTLLFVEYLDDILYCLNEKIFFMEDFIL